MDALRNLRLKKKEADILKKKDIQQLGDPYLIYGFGLIAYRNTLFILSMAFIFFTILSLPLIETYKAGTSWKEGDSKFGFMSLGNMGYNSVQCTNMQLNMARTV